MNHRNVRRLGMSTVNKQCSCCWNCRKDNLNGKIKYHCTKRPILSKREDVDCVMKNGVWALLEIYHDSDNGPLCYDFSHTITLHPTKELAVMAMKQAHDKVLHGPLALTNEVCQDDPDMIVLASDDWWQWKILNVERGRND